MVAGAVVVEWHRLLAAAFGLRRELLFVAVVHLLLLPLRRLCNRCLGRLSGATLRGACFARAAILRRA
eukprot:3542801-Pleurochrysis_carterae.AAC.1